MPANPQLTPPSLPPRLTGRAVSLKTNRPDTAPRRAAGLPFESPLPRPFLSGGGTTLRAAAQPPFFFAGWAGRLPPWSRHSAPTGSRSCCSSTRSWLGCWSEPHFARLSSAAERRNPLLHQRLNRRGGCRISPIPTRPPYPLRKLSPARVAPSGAFLRAWRRACRKPVPEAPGRCRAPRPGRASARRCNMAWGPPSVEVAMRSSLRGGAL